MNTFFSFSLPSLLRDTWVCSHTHNTWLCLCAIQMAGTLFTLPFDSFVNAFDMCKLIGPAVKAETADLTFPGFGVFVYVLVFSTVRQPVEAPGRIANGTLKRLNKKEGIKSRSRGLMDKSDNLFF